MTVRHRQQHQPHQRQPKSKTDRNGGTQPPVNPYKATQVREAVPSIGPVACYSPTIMADLLQPPIEATANHPYPTFTHRLNKQVVAFSA